nr:hypothetical protein BaRGS_027047 [Batillaria attramentaria]
MLFREPSNIKVSEEGETMEIKDSEETENEGGRGIELLALDDEDFFDPDRGEVTSLRKYTPFIFNTLEPYYNTHTTRFLIELPEEQFHAYSSRSTAIGLCDPWVDLRMDQELLPSISSRPTTRHDTTGRSSKRGGHHKEKKGEGPNRKEGSTRLPKFPVVNLETKELATKQLYYSDVPMLRKELKDKYSSQAKQKIDADYKRTQQDFYRMDLDRMDKVAPTSRRHLTSTYMAYLQNTPGAGIADR